MVVSTIIAIYLLQQKILNEDCLMVCIKIKNPKHQNYVKEVVEKHEHIKLRFWSGKWLEISEIY